MEGDATNGRAGGEPVTSDDRERPLQGGGDGGGGGRKEAAAAGRC